METIYHFQIQNFVNKKLIFESCRNILFTISGKISLLEEVSIIVYLLEWWFCLYCQYKQLNLYLREKKMGPNRFLLYTYIKIYINLRNSQLTKVDIICLNSQIFQNINYIFVVVLCRPISHKFYVSIQAFFLINKLYSNSR